MVLLSDFKIALRSLARAKGLSITVILTLALGIGANASIFALVRGVLLRPLVNRDESRLIYIQQSAPGNGVENVAFSVPEIADLRARTRTIASLGEFSMLGFTMIGLGEPRVVRAGVVGGSYFEVMGLRPVLGRLLNAGDDGPNAPGAAVLTHRFADRFTVSDRGRMTLHFHAVAPLQAREHRVQMLVKGALLIFQPLSRVRIAGHFLAMPLTSEVVIGTESFSGFICGIPVNQLGVRTAVELRHRLQHPMWPR